ncbi:MAG: CoA pyrophosphatase [Pseudomonadota bacterium]
MTEDLLSSQKDFRNLVTKRLISTPLDFVEEMGFISERREKGDPWSASGVLLLLEFDPQEKAYTIILNKRSSYVQQPGDLCCPGGRTGSIGDKTLGWLLQKTLMPFLRPAAVRGLQGKDKPERKILSMVLVGVLRESWEEMRLPPWKVEYLGALPTHRLQNFPNIIFPMVGRIRGPWQASPNWEVDKILRVPLRTFFNPENYALYSPRIPDAQRDKAEVTWLELPCMVVGVDGTEEILWGATFGIIRDFLHRVMDMPLNIMRPARVIERDLPVHYFTGRSRDG